MRASLTVRIGMVIGLAGLLAGAWFWISMRSSRNRHQHLSDLGAIAQRDSWGRITQINLWPSDWEDSDFELLTRLDKLRLLNLSATDVGDDELRYVERIDGLEELILNGTKITDAGLIRLQTLKNLKRINIAPSAVTRAGVYQLKQARPDLQIVVNPLELHGLGHFVRFGGHGGLDDQYNLIALDLHDSAVTDDDMLPVLACTQPNMVNLSGTQIGDAGLACIRNMEGLRELWLTGTKVTDEGLKTIAGFKQLKSLSLARTKVSDAGIAGFDSLSALEILHIGETDVSDDGLRHLRGLTRLREVYATASRVTTDGASELGDAIPAVQVFGGSEPEKPIEEIESRVLG